MTRQRLWLAAGLALVLVLAGGLWLVVGRDDRPSECQVTLDAREQVLAERFTSGDRTIAVLGDSYTQGIGLLGPQASWPTALGILTETEVVVDGIGGTGFTTRGFCTDEQVAYGERLDDELPDAPVVVVQGGVNDALSGRPDDVAAAAANLLADLEDVPTVVLVGPPAAPAADPAALQAVDAGLREATEDAGRVYVPLLDAGIELQSDKVHPTGNGQWRIGQLVAAALETAGGAG